MSEARKVIIFCYNLDYDKFLELFDFDDGAFAIYDFYKMQTDFVQWYCNLDEKSESKILAKI